MKTNSRWFPRARRASLSPSRPAAVGPAALFRMVAAGALGLAAVEAARADGTNAPAFTAIRYDEDYTYLRNPEAHTNFFDVIKHIPLGVNDDWYVTLGGQVRDRYEYFQNFNFGSGPQDKDGFNLLRAFINTDIHLSPYIRIFAQGISATEQDRQGGPRPTDANEIDLHQGFVDLMLPLTDDVNFTLRGGRQVMIFGAQRLIGVSDWTNVRRTFDGFRGTLTFPGNTLDLFYTRPVAVIPYGMDDDVSGTSFSGIYDTWQVPVLKSAHLQLETYGLYVNRQSMTFNTTTGEEERYTVGFRLTAKPGAFDFDLEPDYQFGRFDHQGTHSFSVAAVGGYTFGEVMFQPRPFLGFDIASGGKTGNPGDAFDQLFPSGHDQFGIADAIGRQNIIDVHPGVTMTLLQNKFGLQKVTLLTQYRQFWRESNEDAVYNASGSVVRAAGGSGDKSLGGEADVQVNWQVNRYFGGYAGYAHFYAGPFISSSGPGQDLNYAYFALTLTF